MIKNIQNYPPATPWTLDNTRCEVRFHDGWSTAFLQVPTAYRDDAGVPRLPKIDMMDILLFASHPDLPAVGMVDCRHRRRRIPDPEIQGMFSAAKRYGARDFLKRFGMLGGIPPRFQIVEVADALAAIPGIERDAVESWLEDRIMQPLRPALTAAKLAQIGLQKRRILPAPEAAPRYVPGG